MKTKPTSSLHQNQTAEWSFKSSKPRKDPFNEVELSVRFTSADGKEKLVPAFWTGGKNWRVRFSSPMTGKYRFLTVCSDPSDSGLHDQEGDFQIKRYTGSNPLFRHGPVRVATDKRHFEHTDGTPFFWLGDTWWMGLTKRLSWPKGFQTLARDRVKKGFTVVQIVAGLYPDMPAFDARGANEAGFPWEKDYSRINPAYFDMADRRIRHLVESGLAPCIVGCWGYFLPWMGIEKMKKHWKNLVARYGSYPAVWCLAGEGTMPYYLSPNKEADAQFQKKGWTELGAYVRQIDPYRHPITIHPSSSARFCVENPSVLDFDMLQTGHGDRGSLPNTVKRVSEAYRTTPVMPVVEGEVCYEGIGEFCRQEVQRLMFWACILNGAAGFTYGANGIWQVNTRQKPYGPSPHGMTWGNTPWEDAYQLPGSDQIGLAKRFLSRYPWWKFEPHPEWVEPGWTKALCNMPFTCGRHDIPLAAGIPGKLRIIYQMLGTGLKMVKVLEKDVHYKVRQFNPVTGAEHSAGEIKADMKGNWIPTASGLPKFHPMPIFQDWLLILEAQ
ncbi:MAG: DUF4038 domain-containing protein [Kiritimatiellia bacterium]|nr:DUF4038 domain-containing protein [Kiritimatiellia bacterium]